MTEQEIRKRIKNNTINWSDISINQILKRDIVYFLR